MKFDAKKFDTHMKFKGMSIRRLAQKSGVAPATILSIKNNADHTPHGGTLEKLASALGVTIADFYTEDKELSHC